MWMVNSLVFLCLLSKLICDPSGVSGPDCKISTTFLCDGSTKDYAHCELVLVVDGLSVNVSQSNATCKIHGKTRKCKVIDHPLSSNDLPLCSIFKFKISLEAERLKVIPFTMTRIPITMTTLLNATVTADLPCPLGYGVKMKKA